MKFNAIIENKYGVRGANMSILSIYDENKTLVKSVRAFQRNGEYSKEAKSALEKYSPENKDNIPIFDQQRWILEYDEILKNTLKKIYYHLLLSGHYGILSIVGHNNLLQILSPLKQHLDSIKNGFANKDYENDIEGCKKIYDRFDILLKTLTNL